MSSADGSDGPDREPLLSSASNLPEGRTDTLLVETLIHLLMEKGVLTRNDALSIIQTVAQVQQGRLQEGRAAGAAIDLDIQMLRRMFESFEMFAHRAGSSKADGDDNVYPLRPPVYGDQVEFPTGD